MQRSSPFWFSSPKEALSATERARQAARRDTRLDQHMLQPRPEPTPRGPREPRDPQELQRGVEVQVLADSAFDRLFPHAND
jgi:hypothetical protein